MVLQNELNGLQHYWHGIFFCLSQKVVEHAFKELLSSEYLYLEIVPQSSPDIAPVKIILYFREIVQEKVK
jgi:hypothetical protein